MRCEEIRVELVGALRRELDPSTARAVEDHLVGCPGCAAEREEIAATMTLVELAAPAPPPAEAKVDALTRLERERIGDALSTQLGDAPPDALKVKVLRSVRAQAPRRSRARSAAAAALASAAAIGWLVAADARQDLSATEQRLDVAIEQTSFAEAQMGPTGHWMQSVMLTGAGTSMEADIFHFRHDNYRVVVDIDGLPPAPAGHVYMMWMKGEAGEWPLGSLRLEREDSFVTAFETGIDPHDYPELILTRESVRGDAAMSSDVVATATIDEAKLPRDD